jgi:hypothetical protein
VDRPQRNRGLGAVKLGRHIVFRTFEWRRNQPLILELKERSRSARVTVPAGEIAKLCAMRGTKPGRAPSAAVWEDVRVTVCQAARWLLWQHPGCTEFVFEDGCFIPDSDPDVVGPNADTGSGHE